MLLRLSPSCSLVRPRPRLVELRGPTTSYHGGATSTTLTAAAHGWRTWMSKVVVSSTRGPREKINYCTFLRDYLKPEFKDKMYLIAPLTDPGVQLGKHVEMPAVLQCPEMHESVHETRLWMSSGNTTSELHFDTHDNLMLQVFGTKTSSNPNPNPNPNLMLQVVGTKSIQACQCSLRRLSSPQVFGTKSIYFFPPSQSHKMYMDYHVRYGESPVNPERVDLDKWPMFAQLEGGMVAHLRGGDALFIPEGWWHQIRTGPERNAAVTWEFEPYEGLFAFYMGPLADGLWSTFVRRKYAMTKRLTTRGGPIACNETLPARTTADTYKCRQSTGEFCTFRCIPRSCATQQLLRRAKYGYGNELNELLSTFL
jgi:hypothetical protein